MPRAKIVYNHEGGKPWQTFLDRLSNFTCDKKNNQVALENWDEVQIMGYFISQIKKHLDLDYFQIMTYEGEALRHPQMRILRKIIVALHQPDLINDPYACKLKYMPNKDNWNRFKVKAYIDWSIKRIKSKTIFSLNYLTRDKDIQSFLNQFGKIDRNKELTTQLKEIVPNYINTYGDLAFYSQRYTLDNNIINLLEKLEIDLCQVT